MPFSYWMHSPWHFITSSYAMSCSLTSPVASHLTYSSQVFTLFFTLQSLSYQTSVSETNTPEFPKPTCLCVHLASYKERFCTEPAHIWCPLWSPSRPSNECQATMNLTNECCHSICVSCMVWTCYKSPNKKSCSCLCRSSSCHEHCVP